MSKQSKRVWRRLNGWKVKPLKVAMSTRNHEEIKDEELERIVENALFRHNPTLYILYPSHTPGGKITCHECKGEGRQEYWEPSGNSAWEFSDHKAVSDCNTCEGKKFITPKWEFEEYGYGDSSRDGWGCCSSGYLYRT